MSDSETESDSVSGASFKSRSSRSSLSGSTTSDPPVLSDCQRKKQALDDIRNMDKNIATHRAILENEKKTGKPELALQIQNSIELYLEIREKNEAGNISDQIVASRKNWRCFTVNRLSASIKDALLSSSYSYLLHYMLFKKYRTFIANTIDLFTSKGVFDT
ncbi:hypothetical protein TNIN_306151 [Trichonephila inaurata madagascariensis]|uniref:Uncharacterized protein n=1 Tax=Trichonephila inaurata madagascariensis TaxID=2747483 RepID=A0A8X7CDI3_9ARAC|nr:hypothetical protein TNIN_306151 [Trichonephila inaurata madagascariensis]